MTIILDRYQQRACRVECNAVITAGAGSGKTSVLAERFTWLLETGRAEIEGILSLTFTRKATAEMVEKIYRRLKSSADLAVRAQLRKFDQAQISTLDSFCAQIVRNAASRFGLPPDFENDDEGVQRIAHETAVELLLARLDNPGLARLLERFGFERVVEEVFVELARGYLHLSAAPDFAGMLCRQARTLASEMERHLGDWERSREELLNLEPRTGGIRNNQEAARALGDLAGLYRAGRYAELAGRAAAPGLRRSGGSAEDLQLMNGLVEALRAAAESIARLAATLQQEEALRALFELVAEYHRELNRRKLRERRLSFQDVAHLAVQALLQDQALRDYYKRRYRYIMIDEFQDNNRLQKELLYLLAERLDRRADGIPAAADLEPDKLFFVGDEKQSIYRFRGADVSVFKSLSDELPQADPEPLTLPVNYRSEPGLVRFFNRIFERVMADAREPWEARFLPLEPRQERGSLVPEVLFLLRPPVNGAEEGETPAIGASESEAFRIAEVILEAVESGRLAVAGPDGERRAAGFDDFALLLRSTGNQILYERAFRRLNIPYTTQNTRSLFLEAPLYDLYQVLQLVVYPQDTAAYAALLRSPLVNVSDHTLLRVLSPGGDSAGPVDPFAPEALEGLEEEERIRMDLGRELLETARQLADRVPLTDLVDRLWEQAGYSYFILQNPRNHNLLEYHEYLVRLAERADRDGRGLASFLDYLRGNLGSYEKLEELELLKGRAVGVQIMTIHRAKGLEFPVVVLPDLGNRGRSNSQASAPCYVLPEHGLTFNLGERNYFALLGKAREEEEEIAELKRLFYVALTRARCHLILSGVNTARNQGSRRTHLNMLLAGLDLPEPETAAAAELVEERDGYRFRLRFLRDVGEEEYLHPPARRPKRSLEELVGMYEQAQEIRRLHPRREHTVTALAERYCREQAAAAAGGGERAPRLPALPIDQVLQERELEGAFGSLTHHLIQQRLLGREEDLSGPWLQEVPEEHRPAFLAEARRLASRFLDSELGRQALRAEVLLPEYPFLFRRGEHWISGRADLYFESGAQAWLIDFKTDRSLRSEQYAAQLELYRLALQELTDLEIVTRIVPLRSGEPFDPGPCPGLEKWLDRAL